MARQKKPFGVKGSGCKKRKTRPVGYSRTGLPKLFPPGVDNCLRAKKNG